MPAAAPTAPTNSASRATRGPISSSSTTSGSSRYAPPGPEDLYDVINERYERASIVLTSNRDRAEWPELFGEALLASAALDRLTHSAHFVEIGGASFRAEATKKQTAARRGRSTNDAKA